MTELKALILAAGFGTRLEDLTKHCPKALVDIGHGRLIDSALWHVRNAGIRNVIINLHYLGGQIKEYLRDGSHLGLKISYSEEDPILDTGGAIKRVFQNFQIGNLLVINCDAVFGSDLDLLGFVNACQNDKAKPVAGMSLKIAQGDNSYGIVELDSSCHISGILGKRRVPEVVGEVKSCIFTGIQWISSEIVPYLETFPEIFSSTKDLYPYILSKGGCIRGELYEGFWRDTGTKLRLAEVQEAV
ncbi:MAG: NTP transferase domain-containing protein, partial [Bdellovibrionales bacterium]|nr:NTP transferase domain-containing protein [Bdellovibrionales bacterium]